MITTEKLYQLAKKTVHPISLKADASAGQVACALETITGKVFTGICIDMPCSLGFCAEQAAIAEMLKSGETQIAKIVAVYEDGSILAPCGRCREFISQLNENNRYTIVVIGNNQEMKMEKLLPEQWDKHRDTSQRVQSHFIQKHGNARCR